jgi:hypothetical protein
VSVADDLLSVDHVPDGDRVAIRLLAEHRRGVWLAHPRFLRDCIRYDERAEPYVAWDEASGLITGNTNRSSAAVLLTAMHLAGQDMPGLALGAWWRHLDLEALASVVRAIGDLSGVRVDVSYLTTEPEQRAEEMEHG